MGEVLNSKMDNCSNAVFGFRINGQDKVTYKDYRGGIRNLGLKTLEYVAETPESEMRGVASRLKLVDGEDEVPQNNLKRYRPLLSAVGAAHLGKSHLKWRHLVTLLSGHEGQDFFLFNKMNHLVNGVQNLLYGGCSYAYVIDIDKKRIEFLEPFTAFHDFGRYSKPNDRFNPASQSYQRTGLVLVQDFSFAEVIDPEKKFEDLVARVEERSRLFLDIHRFNNNMKNVIL